VTQFVSQALGKQDRVGFTSGNDRIDSYFRNVVTQDIKRKYAACYVLTDKQSGQIAGFYTLSAHAIALTDVPEETARKLPRCPTVPAVLIGWMGRDINFRGQQIGTLLLADAIRRLCHSPVGAHAICADAIDEQAAAFYREHQFLPLVSRPMSLFLPMKTASALIEGV
jgi:ribosomal protein S18 acetylase RimI-like enzyme